MPADAHDPIAIVGLGPVGATLAALLGAAGVRVDVYEREPQPHRNPRAAHVDDETLRILQAAGVADAVAASGRAIDGMDVVDARGRRLLLARKHPAGVGWPAATLIHQPDLESALRERLRAHRNVDVHLGHEVRRVTPHDSGATLELATPHGPRTSHAGWVVGCDGAGSTVRDALGADMRPPGLPFEERWLVVDARLRGPALLPSRLTHVADARRPTTYVPFAGRRRRWEFRIDPGEDASAVTRPESIAALLEPHVDPALLDVERATVYRFAGAVASRWRRGRLLLAGDAAHVMPPFIGQGLCAGLRDAAFLGWALAAVARGAAPTGLLDAYEAERRPHAVAAIRLSVRVGRFVGAGPAPAAVRDALVAALRRAPAGLRRLDAIAVRAPRLGAVVAGAHGQPLRALPQPWVETAAGERLRLDDALGPGWAVIGLGLDPAVWAGDHPAWTAAGARFLRVLGPSETDHSAGPALRDPANALTDWAGRRPRPPLAVVVRPDRVVFGVYRGGSGTRAGAEVGRWFGR